MTRDTERTIKRGGLACVLDRIAVRWLTRGDPSLVADLQAELARTKWWEPGVVGALSRTLTVLGETPERKVRNTGQ